MRTAIRLHSLSGSTNLDGQKGEEEEFRVEKIFFSRTETKVSETQGKYNQPELAMDCLELFIYVLTEHSIWLLCEE